MTREEVKLCIEEIGIFPGLRVDSADQALYAAQTLYAAGLPVAEITMTVPGAIDVICELAQKFPNMVVGAGTVLEKETAERCLDAGARFLTSTGLVPEVMGSAHRRGVVVIPGALTPTEVIAAWKAGADFVKVYPCSAVGGPSYIKSMRGPFPEASLLAAGGVNQHTAADYIMAGAAVLGIGVDLIPRAAIHERNRDWINELAHRFLGIVKAARARLADR